MEELSKIVDQLLVMTQTDGNLVESCRILRERVESLEKDNETKGVQIQNLQDQVAILWAYHEQKQKG